MAKVRSPNYPSIPLGPALEAVRPAFLREHRNKMSRAVLAKHLGYSSLNGRALGMIGAVRAYGLIEGSGNELKISDDAVPALAAPMGAPEKQAALARLALRPSLFADIRKQYPETHPSPDNLAFWLVTQGFTQKAAEKAAKSYLSTMNLVSGVPDAYNPEVDEDEADDEKPSNSGFRPTVPSSNAPSGGKVKIMDGERVAFTEEGQPGQYLKLIASGEVDDSMLEALEDFVKRQRKRLANWYAIIFTSDQAEQEIKHFASALKSKWEAAGMPRGCLARRQKSEAGNQIVMLSPEAGALVWQIPAYKSLLLPTVAPADPNNIPGFTPMGIFS